MFPTVTSPVRVSGFALNLSEQMQQRDMQVLRSKNHSLEERVRMLESQVRSVGMEQRRIREGFKSSLSEAARLAVREQMMAQSPRHKRVDAIAPRRRPDSPIPSADRIQISSEIAFSPISLLKAPTKHVAIRKRDSESDSGDSDVSDD